jgi:hypothetical protein
MTNRYPPLREQRCANCRYAFAQECHRNAPQARVTSCTIARWLTVEENDWCGEWAPAEAGQ